MSLKSLTLGALAGAAMLFAAGAVSAQSSLATGRLSFVQTNGTAGPNDVIQVYLRLTLDESSVALSVDEFGAVTSGGPSLSEIADAGIDVNQSYGVGIGGYVGCGGSFFPTGCSGGEYAFDFNPAPVNFTLNGGESLDFLWLTFTPSGGPAAPGIYNFYETAITLDAYGQDANGDFVFRTFSPFGATCTHGDNSCDFSRTVAGGGGGGVVPEPATWALMIGGFGLAGSALRRRRAVLA